MKKLFSNDPAKTKTWSGKFKKQESWFKTDQDIRIEDSFKFWFALMWQNTYIPLFVLGFLITLLELTHMGWCIDTYYDNPGFFPSLFTIMGLSIGPVMAALVGYKGLWQYWDDTKKLRSR